MTLEMTSIHDEMPVRRAADDLGRGEWLALERLHIEHPNGKIHTWESVKRLKNRGAVVIIAKIMKSNKYVLIRQYRPAINALVLEFPAGLIDPGETVEETALRELTEETGYHGRIVATTPMTLSSPGMSAEGVAVAFLEIDDDTEENREPQQNCEENERIEVIVKPIAEIAEFLETEALAGVHLDSRLVSFFLGLLNKLPKSWSVPPRNR